MISSTKTNSTHHNKGFESRSLSLRNEICFGNLLLLLVSSPSLHSIALVPYSTQAERDESLDGRLEETNISLIFEVPVNHRGPTNRPYQACQKMVKLHDFPTFQTELLYKAKFFFTLVKAVLECLELSSGIIIAIRIGQSVIELKLEIT